jgi:hypothetical protein
MALENIFSIGLSQTRTDYGGLHIIPIGQKHGRHGQFLFLVG